MAIFLGSCINVLPPENTPEIGHVANANLGVLHHHILTVVVIQGFDPEAKARGREDNVGCIKNGRENGRRGRGSCY